MAKKRSGRKSKGASLNDLRTSTHRGRASKSQPSNGSPFISGNGLAKLTAPAMLHGISPTPSGPEPHYPAG